VHSAALADKGGIIGFREEIGKYNAIDKIIGDFIQKNKSFKDKFLLTLVDFARGNRMNIYSADQKITIRV
jgi:formate dehydrogenase assembly factor FdhD